MTAFTDALLVKRMHYVSFVGMLRADFFEGLHWGHGPKRCLNCNRWFLTTNGYLTKYCDGLAPKDPRGRTCRFVGAKAGEKEDPKGHTIKQEYETRRNSVSKAVHRGSMDKELAIIIMKLAEEKRTKAFRDKRCLHLHIPKRKNPHSRSSEMERKNCGDFQMPHS